MMEGWEIDSNWEHPSPAGEKSYPTFYIYNRCLGRPIEWYGVKIKGAVAEPLPEFDRESEFIIVFSEGRGSSNIDQSETPGLLVSKRESANGVIYATSLYHVEIARAESAVEKQLTGALLILKIPRLLAAMRAHFQNGRVRPGLDIDLSSADLPLAMICETIRRTLDEPEIQQFNVAHILKKPYPEGLAWLDASEELRRDWTYRRDHGDIKDFYDNLVDGWLTTAVEVVALPPAFQSLCID